MEINHPCECNSTMVMVNSVKHKNVKREMRRVENKSDLFLVVIAGYFVANRAFEQMISSVKVEHPKPKQKTSKVRAPKITSMLGRMTSNTRHPVITPEDVSRVMGILLEKSKKFPNVNAQKGLCTSVHYIHRRYRVNHL